MLSSAQCRSSSTQTVGPRDASSSRMARKMRWRSARESPIGGGCVGNRSVSSGRIGRSAPATGPSATAGGSSASAHSASTIGPNTNGSRRRWQCPASTRRSRHSGAASAARTSALLPMPASPSTSTRAGGRISASSSARSSISRPIIRAGTQSRTDDARPGCSAIRSCDICFPVGFDEVRTLCSRAAVRKCLRHRPVRARTAERHDTYVMTSEKVAKATPCCPS